MNKLESLLFIVVVYALIGAGVYYAATADPYDWQTGTIEVVE